jgi:hypothetical protein
MMLRQRPYAGQPHTDFGERGKTLVSGLTMRDICDCFVRGFIMAGNHVYDPALYEEAQKGERGRIDANDLFGVDIDSIDPVAIMQNMMCEVEKMMGIFPNVPKLSRTN